MQEGCRKESLLRRVSWAGYLLIQVPLQRRVPFASPAAIARAQRRRVRRVVAHAYAHVPYYRETIDRLRLTPADFSTAADLARLPLIERAQVQRDPEFFVSTARPIERYVKLATDGTTGAPVTVYYDPHALFQGLAHYERRQAITLKLVGNRFRLRRASIGSPMGIRERIAGAVGSRSLIPVGVRYSNLHLSIEEPPARNVGPINAFRPDTLNGYGSYIEELFAHVTRSGVAFAPPKVVAYGGDGIGEPARRLIAEQFGAEVLSGYGAGEAHHIGFECEEHRGLHLNTDLCPVRIVDAEGRELPTGETGEVVISNLVNKGTVLLNYRLGDLAAMLPERCPCGRSLPLLSFPQGRTDDWVQTPSGELLHPQAVRGLVLADDRWLLTFQITQHSPSHFAISVVTTPDADPHALRTSLQRRFGQRFGEGTVTEVSFVDSLPRTPGGKVRTVTRAPSMRPVRA
jgi:phenylacetate-CoA ligase